VELSAYRIVQEALTNTLKHAGAAHATVRLVWSHDHLDVEVSDDGPAAGVTVPPQVRADSGGKGLVGMRERVMLFGGELEAAPNPHGGYRVAARLPLGDLA
jgi:signal transduction histidine kinase